MNQHSNIHIVIPSPADAAALTQLAHVSKAHWGYPASWIQRWQADLTITPEFILTHHTRAAVQECIFVGFFALHIDAGRASVEHFWIRPSHMSRGIGRALFQQLEQDARAAGASLLLIESDPHAEPFYQRMGARTVGHKPAMMDATPRSLPILQKPLAEGATTLRTV